MSFINQMVALLDWTLNSYNKCYQITSYLVYDKKLNDKVINFLWQKIAPPRAKLIVWFLTKGRLKTRMYLLNVGLLAYNQAMCSFFSDKVETIDNHFFF